MQARACASHRSTPPDCQFIEDPRGLASGLSQGLHELLIGIFFAVIVQSFVTTASYSQFICAPRTLLDSHLQEARYE